MINNLNHSVTTFALQKGDAIAFQQIYEQHCDAVYSYFKKRTNADEASDLMQTTFLKLWQYRTSVSGDYPIEQQLFHIAKTVFIDYLRKENKRAHIEKEMSLQAENNAQFPPSLLDSVSSQLATILSLMPELRRQVFQLIRLQGYSYKETAQLLSISVKAVDNHLTKAIKQLRNGIVISLLLLMLLS
ncbi:MAG: sigma-70 family RNA polymerase sigma factor [Bacteroidota bacterium]|nr:sigma-70 family RNA polymerase sigma factor [Bacteroidota bacterium]